jgi:hypothetical protein
VDENSNPYSGGNAKLAAAGVRLPRQKFETPHPAAADLALSRVRLPDVSSDCVYFARRVSCRLVHPIARRGADWITSGRCSNNWVESGV